MLRKWFTLAAKWGAILLIDEADIFLEKRSKGDVNRTYLATGSCLYGRIVMTSLMHTL